MTESMGQMGFSKTHVAAEGDVLMPCDEVQSEQIHQTRFVDADLGGPIEAFQRALFIEAGVVKTSLDVFVIAPLDLIAQYELKKVRVIELVLTRKSEPVRQGRQHAR